MNIFHDYSYRHYVTQYAIDAARTGISLAEAFDCAFKLSAQYRDDAAFVAALAKDLDQRKAAKVEVPA